MLQADVLNRNRFFEGKRRELDCCHRNYWAGHCHNTSCREKDIIIDGMQRDIIVDRARVAQDQCIKMFYNEKTEKMQGVNDNSPTPRLNVEINQDNGRSLMFDALPDTGSTKANLARNVAEEHGIKWDPMSYDHILTDAQGKKIDVSGITVIKVRAKEVNGDLNKEGRYHAIRVTQF